MFIKNSILFVVVIALLIDVYIFQIVKSLTAGAADGARFITHSTYWIFQVWLWFAHAYCLLFPFINYPMV